MISGILWANESVILNCVARRCTTFPLRLCWQISLTAISRSESVHSQGVKIFFSPTPNECINSLEELLTTAAVWEAGVACGAISPAWGLSVAKAAGRIMNTSVKAQHHQHIQKAQLCRSYPLWRQWPLSWDERWLCRPHRAGTERETAPDEWSAAAASE